MGCSKCGGALPPRAGRGKPRTKCEECSPSRSRVVLIAGRQAAEAATAPSPSGDEPELVAAVRKDLVAAGRDATVVGQLALALARQVASPVTTASGAAAAARQLQATLDVALQGAKAADGVDEMTARRRRVSGS